MTKDQEIKLLRSFAEQMPVEGTYSGGFLRDQIEQIIGSIREDIMPDARAMTLRDVAAMVERDRQNTQNERESIIGYAKDEADRIITHAKATANAAIQRARDELAKIRV